MFPAEQFKTRIILYNVLLWKHYIRISIVYLEVGFHLFKLIHSFISLVSRVRLVNGRNSREGRVELFVRGKWGTICDDNFEIPEAHIVCRMLGFPGAKSAQCCAKYGQGSGRIWLDNLRCRGSESSILQCSHPGIGINNCGHGEDVSVICRPRSEGSEATFLSILIFRNVFKLSSL